MSARLIELTAVELGRGYAAGEISPVEVVEAALARVEAWEPALNAMYLVDREGALAQARACEARWRAGEALGPLDGVPITIKDNIAVAGTPSPLGSGAFADVAAAPADLPPAARVREAGCVLLGKTTMPDLGMLVSGVSSLHGVTRNPWDRARNTGGSSSGAGAALAGLYAPLALGTDIAGSVRLPAAYCGVFAHKPSLGRVPIHPPYWGRTVGPMTRTAADAALLMGVLSREDARDYMSLPYEALDYGRPREVRGLRLGLMMEVGVGTQAHGGGAGGGGGGGAGAGGGGGVGRGGGAVLRRGDAGGARPVLPGAGDDGLPRHRAGEAGEGTALHPGVDAAGLVVECGRAVPGPQRDPADAGGGGQGVPALRLCAVADLADPGLCGRRALPGLGPGAAFRPCLLHGTLQPVGAAGGLDPLRVHGRWAADRAADRRAAVRRSGGAAAGGGV